MDGKEIVGREVEDRDSNWETFEDKLVPLVAALYRKWLETLLSKSGNLCFVNKVKDTLDRESTAINK